MIKKSTFIVSMILLFQCVPSFTIAQESKERDKFTFQVIDSTTLLIKASFLELNPSSTATKSHDHQMVMQSGPKSSRLLLGSLTLASLNYAAYQPFKRVWWEEERTHFHFYQGWRRTRGYLDFGWHDTLYGHIDKLGHYYTSYLMTENFFYICRWIGFAENSSKLISPLLSSLLMLEIEIYDGFFKEWGFSLADFTANELGAFTPLLREKLPILQNFQLKFSYHNSHQPNREPTFIKDYAGMTFWLSCNIHSWLPAKIKHVYPAWLNLALGYSVSRPTRGEIEIFFAPDIDWRKIPIGNSETMTFIKRTLNYFHFPCFAWKLTPQQKFYPAYF